ncbi:MAG: hypothetical protein M0Q92_06560 [Methanoregula sp.]|jgi:hypothetical protein|nr:hypothetical protein [Methanoregula sp.]
MDLQDTSIAVQALWLQYKGLTIESARSVIRVENAAWGVSPPERKDLSEIEGLLVAT